MESKLKVMKEILDFKFKVPINIYFSIFQTMTLILVEKIDLQKDFLVMKVLDIFEALCDVQNASAALNDKVLLQASDDRGSSTASGPVLDYIKWALTLVKEKNNPS